VSNCKHHWVNGRDDVGTFCLNCDEHAKKYIARLEAECALLHKHIAEHNLTHCECSHHG